MTSCRYLSANRRLLLFLALLFSRLEASSVPARPSQPVGSTQADPTAETDTEALPEDVTAAPPPVNTPTTTPTTAPPILYTTAHAVTTTAAEDEGSWGDLVVAVARLVAPYLGYVVPGLRLDWEGAIGSVRSAMSSVDAAKSPVMAAAVGLATLASPVLLQVTRSLVGSLVALVDNSLYVTTGHGLARRSIDDDLLDDLMEVLVSTVREMGDQLGPPP
ncbi:uncharacterized protein LOC122262038 [Penaeus japonicus]|uniref:uncharacterized protein LOC122262038 n=1 Tax=Penaeus japonicus TaxID=27405 RepID=UPI001C715DB5|nr:uncharacterized protein LOC122262038 [Penaeus japonicus]